MFIVDIYLLPTLVWLRPAKTQFSFCRFANLREKIGLVLSSGFFFFQENQYFEQFISVIGFYGLVLLFGN